jgi:hypothetical protein
MALTNFIQEGTIEFHQVIRLQDLFFVFSFCGIASVIYQILVGQHLQKIPRQKKEKTNFLFVHWIFFLILFLSLWICLSLLFSLLFSLHLFFSFIVGGLFMGIYIIVHRRDLLINAVVSALFMALLLFFLEQIFLIRFSPFSFGSFWSSSFPFEEILWSATIGFTLGPLYEYVRRYRLR